MYPEAETSSKTVLLSKLASIMPPVSILFSLHKWQTL